MADMYYLVVGAKRMFEERLPGPQKNPTIWWLTNVAFVGNNLRDGLIPRRMEVQEGRHIYFRGVHMHMHSSPHT